MNASELGEYLGKAVWFKQLCKQTRDKIENYLIYRIPHNRRQFETTTEGLQFQLLLELLESIYEEAHENGVEEGREVGREEEREPPERDEDG